MNDHHVVDEKTVDPCPAGDDNCTNHAEVQRLREEVKQLAALVRTDELTGLFNYRYFAQALSLEMERTRRSGQPTCLIMCDLDHFKSINDVHGHEVGNLVLTHVSSLIRKTIRRLDIPCRYGGEEFALILPDTTLKQGVRFANRLRLIVENSPVKASDLILGIEASCGVDVYERGDQLTEKEFVDQVDGFLYTAKQEGRNRVCHAPYEKGDEVSSEEKEALVSSIKSETN
ncbi:MAG: GGDEF domain-containing protein [Gammaproteobacteria bacterium]|nr:GGDEF domain-containing protein [Gammaproteobacteria bacterium]MDD9895037.1 GGDEF domain-containing protein [Gammaproteobacteria bacterium]MDD9957470.1 GGDEF domain-containing protein [Gammaproteobacteria bacterium]